jgi:nitroreductase
VEGHYATGVDAYLAIASRRDERRYEPQPLPDDVVSRILDAGRLAGSGSNRQPWTFVVVEGRERIEALAQGVYAPENVRGAGLVVAVVVSGKGPVSFDAGRAAQNMLLAAWNEGISSCPNGLADRDAVRAALELGEDESPAIVLTFGVPQRRRDPESRTAADWSARANRRPLEDVVRRLA